MLYSSKRQRLEVMRNDLIRARSPHEGRWRESADYILTDCTEFSTSETNKGDRRNLNIIDSTASTCARNLEAAMVSGIMNPARPWLIFTHPDKELSRVHSVRRWLDTAARTVLDIIQMSNIYNVVPSTFRHIGTFATGAMIVEENFETVAHSMSFPVGSYCIATDSLGRVRVFQRDFRLTVRQMVEMFRVKDANSRNLMLSNLSGHVKNLWENSNYDELIEVSHMIEPNLDHNPKSADPRHMLYASSYYERGGGSGKTSYLNTDDGEKLLRESGYHYFPVLAPRWAVRGNSAYGTDCPGFQAIGDVRQLQYAEKLGLKGLELLVHPPMKGPTSLEGRHSSALPGGMTHVDEVQGGTKYEAAVKLDLPLAALEAKNDRTRQRIERTYFQDIVLPVLYDQRNQRATAAEIFKGSEESLMVFGPTLQQVDKDLNDPLVAIVFDFATRQGKIPEPPEELQGQPILAKYISTMAQAQRMVGLGVQERFIGFAGQVIGMNEASKDKVDFDEILDVYGDSVGLAPSVIRSDEQVEEIRAAAAQGAQAQAMINAVQQSAAAARDLSQANLDGNNALSALVNGEGEAGV